MRAPHALTPAPSRHIRNLQGQALDLTRETARGESWRRALDDDDDDHEDQRDEEHEDHATPHILPPSTPSSQTKQTLNPNPEKPETPNPEVWLGHLYDDGEEEVEHEEEHDAHREHHVRHHPIVVDKVLR